MNLDLNSHVRGKLCTEVAPRSPRARPMTSYPDTLRQALLLACNKIETHEPAREFRVCELAPQSMAG